MMTQVILLVRLGGGPSSALRHATGARHGASAVPAAWRDAVHGWPGLKAGDLIALAARAAG